VGAAPRAIAASTISTASGITAIHEVRGRRDDGDLLDQESSERVQGVMGPS
jgi:hypothetical protein